MIKKYNKPIAFIMTMMLTFTLVCTVHPTTAFAAPGDTGVTGSWYWEVLDDGTIAIKGCSPDGVFTAGNITVPDTLDIGSGPQAVTAIGDHAFDGYSLLTGVTLPDGIKSIEDTAFSGCTGLTSITLPEGLESIGQEAFYCTGLTSVTIPSSVTMVSTGAFLADYDLETAVITAGLNPLTVGNGIFESCSSLNAVTLNRLDSISTQMFSYCPDLQSITIPASVTSIADLAFSSNNPPGTGLTGIVIPDTVTSIGDSAFQNCSDLSSVVLPDNVTFTEIPSGLFMGCSSLTSIDIPSTVTSIGGSAFAGCGFTSFTIPNTVTSIGNGLFSNCTSLSNITLPTNASITSIPDGLAGGCSSLESIIIPANMTSIGDGAFGETGFRAFTVPDHVTSIGEFAFCECEFLTEVSMSANVASIGDFAFAECPLLTKATIPGISVLFGDFVFFLSAITGTGSGIGIFGLSNSDVDDYADANGIQFHSIGSVPEEHHGGGGGGGSSIQNDTSDIKTTASGNTATVNIPKAALEQAADGKDALILSTPVASLSFDTAALTTIFGEASGDVNITVTKVDSSPLTDETKQLVGDRPVFNFSVTSGNDTISEFGGNVTVAVPYTPKPGEDTDAIVIYYINAEGKPKAVANCKYDPATKTVVFTTNHFSQYAVGYNKVSFNDVKAGAWYENAVEFAAARGIVTGTGNGNYSPDGKLTRGQLLVMLMRAYGIEPDTDPSDNFSDAGNTYYTSYLAAAKRLGITEGLGNNLYAPEKQITRQEMFTLLYNTLKVIGQLPEGTGKASGALTGYSDSKTVASWAKDAAGSLADAGIVGGSNGKLSPKNTTTRAEMAQVLYNLLTK